MMSTIDLLNQIRDGLSSGMITVYDLESIIRSDQETDLFNHRYSTEVKDCDYDSYLSEEQDLFELTIGTGEY